jgi:hypothetical protein
VVGWVYLPACRGGGRRCFLSDWLRKSRERPVQGRSDAGNMQGRAVRPPRLASPAAIGVPGIAAVRSTFKPIGARFSMALQQQQLRES